MIGIVILNYNSYQDTIDLVVALQKQTVSSETFTLIVDNASPNDSYTFLKPLEEKYENLVVLQTGENLGYAKGNNYGLYYLDKHIHPEYVAILNNDIILKDDCFEKLIAKYKTLEEPAIIAPKQLNNDLQEVKPYKMNSFIDDCLNLFFAFKIFHKRNQLAFHDNSSIGAMKVDMIHGSFMFSSFQRFKEMGFFYPNTFLYVEERFIAMEAKNRNWNNYIVLDQTYVHAHSKTISTVYSQLNQFKLLYKGWVEFTKIHRSNGRYKANILQFLMFFSMIELKLVNWIKKNIGK